MSFNLQSAICGLCLQSAVCGRQSAVCILQSAVCSLQMSYTGFTISGWDKCAFVSQL